MYGGAGNDSLFGDYYDDNFNGGPGADRYFDEDDREF
jgi:Ca2+-binding RTX toxin-like protein